MKGEGFTSAEASRAGTAGGEAWRRRSGAGLALASSVSGDLEQGLGGVASNSSGTSSGIALERADHREVARRPL